MNPSPVFSRSASRLRGVSGLFLLLALMLCGARGAPPVQGPPLAGGLVQERELRGGETHVYPVDLQAGQFLRVKVQEQGIDVAVRLLDPKGAFVTGADSPTLFPADSLEDLASLIVTPGPYLLEVGSSSKLARPGRYRLEVAALGQATEDADRLRSEAVRAVWEVLHPAPGEDGEDMIAEWGRVRALWERLGERRKMAEALFFLGREHYFLPQKAETALDEFQRSAALWREETDPGAKDWQAQALNSAGNLLKALGRLGEARKDYEEALALTRMSGDLGSQAISLSNLAMLDIEQGEFPRGVAFLQESLQKAREAGDRSTQAKTLNNLGVAYDHMAERQKALETHQQALELARATSNPGAEAYALNNLGYTYLSLGDSETALKRFRQALTINRRLGARPTEAATLINIGDTLLRLKRFDEARKSFDQALALSRELKDPENQTFALTNQAFLFLKLKQPARAAEFARQALGLARGFPDREVTALYALGSAHRDLGDLPAAREELGKALSRAHDRGDRTREAEIGLRLARVERETGDLAKALDRIRSVVDIIESIRTRVFDPRLRASFLAAKQDSYETYVDTLMASPGAPPSSERIAEALQVNERARARSLLDILNESGADVRVGADPALVDREHRLRDEVNARDGYHFKLLNGEKPDRRKLEEAERKLEETLDAYSQVRAELRASSPGYAALTQPQPLSVAEIQSQVLDGKALLLEYALGTKRSFLWVVTPDAIRSFELPGRERIERAARRYYELVTARNERRTGESLADGKRRIDAADAEAESVGRDLSRLLLAPAERLLGDRPLLIVADGALQYIPFAALPIPASGAPLATRHDVVSLPSASALAVLRREVRGRSRAPKTLAVFGDPVFQATDERLARRPGHLGLMKLTSTIRGAQSPTDPRRGGEERLSFQRLFSSGKEAKAIAALVPPGQRFLALGFEASRSQATNPDLGQYRNVHFATHGVLDSSRPELSKLVLSLYDKKGKTQDGFLRLNDIYNLRLGADLVVLSACQTALGQEIRGEGLVGLTRGFMYAGAARVVASLWSVEDRATAELMESFYRGMLRQGLSPAAALRRAQLEMARAPGRKSPYYWAGFSLQGEWR
jgi:CHAT domain-containing protein/tetratricopeptide (TPR) repeat protein